MKRRDFLTGGAALGMMTAARTEAKAMMQFTEFRAGDTGAWRIEQIKGVTGETLPNAERLAVLEGEDFSNSFQKDWRLKGFTTNTRYTTRREADSMAALQEGLGRPNATRAALIPIRKNEAWWALAQDERRAIFEEQSHHIDIGLKYLPAIARRLYHCRDLGEPFDFLTWFEYAPEDATAFEDLVAQLRSIPEWRFVEREVDIRLSR